MVGGHRSPRTAGCRGALVSKEIGTGRGLVSVDDEPDPEDASGRIRATVDLLGAALHVDPGVDVERRVHRAGRVGVDDEHVRGIATEFVDRATPAFEVFEDRRSQEPRCRSPGPAPGIDQPDQPVAAPRSAIAGVTSAWADPPTDTVRGRDESDDEPDQPPVTEPSRPYDRLAPATTGAIGDLQMPAVSMTRALRRQGEGPQHAPEGVVVSIGDPRRDQPVAAESAPAKQGGTLERLVRARRADGVSGLDRQRLIERAIHSRRATPGRSGGIPGGVRPSRSPAPTAAAHAVPDGTTRLTRPMPSASSAPTARPVSTRSSAQALTDEPREADGASVDEQHPTSSRTPRRSRPQQRPGGRTRSRARGRPRRRGPRPRRSPAW